MGSDEQIAFASRWTDFVATVQAHIDSVWAASTSRAAWHKPDGTWITSLDLLLDVGIRSHLASHFPELEVLSEETGLLQPVGVRPAGLAIIDPVDGTESLVKGRDSWWVSIGLIDGIEQPAAGWVYQPATRRTHNSQQLSVRSSPDFVVGLSPDRLRAPSTLEMRARLHRAGARFIDTPHAVEKIAAVLEGRAAATVYLPSAKSPSWRSWDLAAGVAIARAAGLHLTTADGNAVQVTGETTTFTSAWICAISDEVLTIVREAL